MREQATARYTEKQDNEELYQLRADELQALYGLVVDPVREC